jgi:hypothetical protein
VDQDQNQALAADLCERALFTFGRVTTSSFRQKLEQGQARLDFRRPENRQFWLAGYHYIKSLIRKGTYRTALEWSKLLLSLDNTDPYAMKNFVHVLAIRAQESKWFLEFCDSGARSSDKDDDLYIKQTKVLAKLQQKDADGARVDLVEGMETLPWLYCSLFQALNVEAPSPIWGVEPDTDERRLWTNLYIRQAKDIWNNSQATSLLKEAAKAAKKIDINDLPAGTPCDLRTARLAYLEGDTGLLKDVPKHLLEREPQYQFDPLPPAKEDNIFTSMGGQLPWLHEKSRGTLLEQLLGRRLQFGGRRIIAGQAPGGPAGPGPDFGDVDIDEILDFSDDDTESDEGDDRDALRIPDDFVEEYAQNQDRPEAGLLASLAEFLYGRFGAPVNNSEGAVAGSADVGEGEMPGTWPSERRDENPEDGHQPPPRGEDPGTDNNQRG